MHPYTAAPIKANATKTPTTAPAITPFEGPPFEPSDDALLVDDADALAAASASLVVGLDDEVLELVRTKGM